MEEELELQTSDDLVGRLAHEGDPVRAVVELVWNAIDAEATSVEVLLERSVTDAVVGVRVVDDGHGVTSDEVRTTFGRIGDSWKKRQTRSLNDKRALHGKLGEGRLRAFALGSRVTWQSHSVNTAGEQQRVQIHGDKTNRKVFRWDVAPALFDKTGTTVIADNDEQRSLGALEKADAPHKLLQHFAPVLLNDGDLTVLYDGTQLEPADEIQNDTTLTIGTEDAPIRIRIIEWKSGKHRAIYYGADQDHFVQEEPGGDVEGQFAFSAYVTLPSFDDAALRLLTLGDLAPEEISAVWHAVHDAIREHFRSRRLEQRRKQIDVWKENGSYPYAEEPQTESEAAERAVFDVISGAVATHIPKRKSDAKLTLTLLRDAIRHDPEQLEVILHEVVALTPQDRDALTRLLRETSLSAIIRSANLVANRHKFLAGLEHLLFSSADDELVINERDHLHKILEKELWVFGEQYHLMTSEKGLTEMLRTHLRLEGLPTSDVTPVKRWDGKTGRVDLHLAAQYREHDRVRHLVVELKAPDITTGRTELNQVEDYANTVLDHAAFASDTAVYDFILVVTDYDKVTDHRIFKDKRELGQFLDPEKQPGRPAVRAYVRRWRDIIDENKRRLEFVTNRLETDPSITEGLAFVKEQYADILPSPTAPAEGDGDGDQQTAVNN